ncbi:hypothetical protein AB0M43_19900 [Longispora sp. NPDC051575]|uniref:WXG100 family type VII secretion target n=1 Tax=Longispora sp. NPDC051575 TaxID=3154943 RepID=UPI00342B21EF
MTTDWSTMVRQVVIQGRPGDLKSAALGWEQLLKQAGQVKATLERDVSDLARYWTGPAYEAYKTHVLGIAKKIGDAIDKANAGTGIAPSLREAASRLAEAQAAMPVPHGMLGDLLAARNGQISLGPKFCELSLSNELFNNPVARHLGNITDLLEKAVHDIEGPARKAYDKVSGDYEGVKARMPEGAGTSAGYDVGHEGLDLTDTPPAGTSGGPDLGSGGAYTPNGFAPHQPSPMTPANPTRDAWNRGWEDAGDFRPPRTDATTPSTTGLAGLGDSFGSGGTPLGSGTLGAGAGAGLPAQLPGGGTLGRPVDLLRTLAAGNAARAASPGLGSVGAIGSPAARSAEDDPAYSTWLREDKTIWYGDEEIAPAVLGKVEEPVSDWPAGVEMVRFVRPQD